MRSSIPKVLHRVAGRTMLSHALAAVQHAGASKLQVVVGPDRDDVSAEARSSAPHAGIVTQTERRGTAHAVLAARAALADGCDDVVVAFADTPLVSPDTYRRLRGPLSEGAAVAVLAFEAIDPTGYGRVIGSAGEASAIREEREARPEERAIRLCNAGLMALRGDLALSLLEAVGDGNAKREFYLTDVVEIARARGERVAVVMAGESEVLGVNDRVQLAGAERILQGRLREAAMRSGVTLVAPDTVTLSTDTELGPDVTVEPYVVFGLGVRVEAGATIRAFSHLEGARVGAGATVGPYARLRPGAVLGEGVHVGNFVEIKNAELGAGAKANHLAYLGDATIGARTNVGAGTITCNYDGVNKHRTVIGADAFVGTNSSLVAPVTIGDGAYIGSGSVITADVPADALALGRGRQAVKAGWAKAKREARKAKSTSL